MTMLVLWHVQNASHKRLHVHLAFLITAGSINWMFSLILHRLHLPVSLFNLIIFLSNFNHFYLDIIMLSCRFSDEIHHYYTSVAVAA